MSSVILPGSYDPVTLGHIAVIREAAKRFDEVYVVAFVNPEKSYRFPLETRLSLLRAACSHLPNVTVVSDGGRVVDFAAANGVSAILKGVRSEVDFLYEREMADVNRSRGVETVLLPTPPELREISSTALRAALDEGRDLSPYLPARIAEMVQKYRR